jgi:hypothetical protein
MALTPGLGREELEDPAEVDEDVGDVHLHGVAHRGAITDRYAGTLSYLRKIHNARPQLFMDLAGQPSCAQLCSSNSNSRQPASP